jgi:hypothetical protein
VHELRRAGLQRAGRGCLYWSEHDLNASTVAYPRPDSVFSLALRLPRKQRTSPASAQTSAEAVLAVGAAASKAHKHSDRHPPQPSRWHGLGRQMALDRSSTMIRRLRPYPPRSSSPSMPKRFKRCSQHRTVFWLQPSSTALAGTRRLAQLSSIVQARLQQCAAPRETIAPHPPLSASATPTPGDIPDRRGIQQSARSANHAQRPHRLVANRTLAVSVHRRCGHAEEYFP